MLVCTVGGAPEPVAAAVKGNRPLRTLFITSRQTESVVRDGVLPILEKEGISLTPDKYEVTVISDAEHFPTCAEEIRRLSAEVATWTAKGEDFLVVADFTGGTKCMSAALSLIASRWENCWFSYIGGRERNKGGVGTVISGNELFLCFDNPWDSLGYQAVEEASLLFDRGDYRACVLVLEEGKKRVSRRDLKDALHTLKELAEGYLKWDLFCHRDALTRLRYALDRRQNLAYLFPTREAALVRAVEQNINFLINFEGGIPGRHTLLDLLANARRCAEKGRYDDAVARLYRAVEATAQLQLHQQYHMYRTGDRGEPIFSQLDPARVPGPLREAWQGRAGADGFPALGLLDDYRLLEALGDPLAGRFDPLKGEKSPLTARNSSILAHGFDPVGQEVYRRLWGAIIELTGVGEEQLPRFPTLGCSLLEKTGKS